MIVAAALIAGALGAVLRFLLTRALATRPGWAVLAVNVLGSAIGGVLLALATGDLRLILLSGFCGGLTTFSTFGVETIQFAMEGKLRAAALNVAANLVLGIGAAAIAFGVTSAA